MRAMRTEVATGACQKGDLQGRSGPDCQWSRRCNETAGPWIALSECGPAIAPYFIFTDIDIPVPRYGITTLLHVNRLEQGRVSQGSKQLPFQQGSHVVFPFLSVIELDQKSMVVNRFNGFYFGTQHGYCRGGSLRNSWKIHISFNSFLFKAAHSTTSCLALFGRSPSIISKVLILSYASLE